MFTTSCKNLKNKYQGKGEYYVTEYIKIIIT